MMASAPFSSRAPSLLEELNSSDNGIQQINSGISSLTFNPTLSPGVIEKPNLPISPLPSTMDGSFRSGLPLEQSPCYPSSHTSMSPNSHQQNRSQKPQFQSADEFPQAIAPTNNSFTAFPFIHEKRTFSPSLNTPLSSDGRSSHSSGKKQQDLLGSLLDTSGSDRTGSFLLDHDNQPQSPFISTPRNCSNLEDLNKESSHPIPVNYLRQASLDAISPSPAPLGQILYEDKPSSWDEGSGFPVPNLYKKVPTPSTSNVDRFNSRPPLHCGTNGTQALVSPRIEIRHTASDGNFHKFQSAVPIFHPMSPVAVANNHRQSQSNLATMVGPPNFDSLAQAGHSNDRNSFGSTDTLNNSNNFIQGSVPPGNSHTAHVQQDTYFGQHSPAQPTLQRHHSTGSQHFLINDRGEIVGHASPVITHNSLEPRIVGFTPGEPTNHQASPFNPIQQVAPSFTPTPFQNSTSQYHIISSPMENHVGSIGDGRTQQRLTLFNSNSGGNIQSRHPSTLNDSFNQPLTEETAEDIELPSEDIQDSIGIRAVEGKASNQSYASKLMMPCPQPVVDDMAGQASSQLLTAGANLSKAGPRMVYNVKFKRSQKNFILGQRVTREIKIGCYVKVEADRGEDLGIVMSIVPMAKFLASNRHRSMTEDTNASGDPSPSQATNIGDLKRIMRVATHDEISLLEVKREEEEELLKICLTKVRQRGLPMSVVDAEYQYDRNKLTFFFQAEGRIDFRELVRDLFSMYKTRIWMQQLDKNGSPESDRNKTD